MAEMTGTHAKRRRSAPLLWVTGAVAAALMVLSVNGTLAAWSTAIIDNSNNSAASTAAYSLKETGPGGVCDTASSATNQVNCTVNNKFGGIGTAAHDALDTTGVNSTNANGAPLSPGGPSQAVTVTMLNNGTTNGNLTLDAGACKHYAYPGSSGADVTNYNLCTQMNLAVSCTDPAGGSTPAFTYSGTVGGFTGTAKAIAALTTGQSTACTFTLSLPSDAPSGYSSQYLTQDLKWTLGA